MYILKTPKGGGEGSRPPPSPSRSAPDSLRGSSNDLRSKLYILEGNVDKGHVNKTVDNLTNTLIKINYCHQTGAVKPVYRIPTFPLTEKAVQSS